jgi:hypothetical protein
LNVYFFSFVGVEKKMMITENLSTTASIAGTNASHWCAWRKDREKRQGELEGHQGLTEKEMPPSCSKAVKLT